jgi:2-aminoadipate transaminase
LEGLATWSEPEGGYFLWVDLPTDAGELLARAEAAGVTFVKGTDFFPAAPSGVSADAESAQRGQQSARLAFSYASPSEIDEGVSTLAALLRD